MEDNKYYTPELSDFYPGYEFEVYNANIGYEKIAYGTYQVSESLIRYFYESDIASSWIRTPYLTKKQIEAEAWTVTQSNDLFQSANQRYTLHLYPNNRLEIRDHLEVSMFTHNTYCGECKSINEFRTILKLFKI